MVWLIALVCAGPAGKPSVAEAAPPVENSRALLASRPFQGGEVLFLGERLPKGLSPWFGVREVQFRLGKEPPRAFVPKGRVEDTDWRFEIVSPDGRWVVLPQDHYGPYHVVATSRLGTYLSGGKADHVLHQSSKAENAGAWVHADARWDGQAVAYRAGLSELMEFRFELP